MVLDMMAKKIGHVITHIGDTDKKVLFYYKLDEIYDVEDWILFSGKTNKRYGSYVQRMVGDLGIAERIISEIPYRGENGT